MLQHLFSDWRSLIGVAISAPLIYGDVVAFFRLSGKCSTSQMNNSDWVVIVVIGSLIANGVMSDKVTVADTLLGIGILLVLQFLVSRFLLYSRDG